MNTLENKYAVVGIGCLFPDAEGSGQFWQNIVNEKVSIKELGPGNIDSAVYYDPGVYGKANKEDKTYTRVGAAIRELLFDGSVFRIPPAIAKHMDDNQKAALLSVQQALVHKPLAAVGKERVAVIMGVSGYGDLHHDFHGRFSFSKFAHYLRKNRTFADNIQPGAQEEILAGLRSSCLSNDFCITEDSAPGMLPSIIASRIANVHDLHGIVYTVDAACASGLAAVSCGIRHLRYNEADAAICGAVDMPLKETGFIYFSGIGALSPDGSYPFDERANGFVIGQGSGIVILKRLADAVSANDPIYAVITGYGSMNDGKGKAIAAPNSTWQARTIEQACRMAGYPIDTVELIEAHGTATQVGDQSEAAALKRSFGSLGVSRKNFCGITSVKSNIGHLKAAAGIAGFIKTVLAIKNRTLPPLAGFVSANKKLGLEDSPFYLIDHSREWTGKAYPRRAGVNAFGFGGVNYHIALEEYRPGDYSKAIVHPVKQAVSPAAVVGGQLPPATTFADEMQVIPVSANTGEEFISRLQELKSRVLAGSLASAADTAAGMADAAHNWRAAFICSSAEQCLESIELLTACSLNADKAGSLKAKGIFFSSARPLRAEQAAFLFPGQGAQYPDMLAGLPEHYSSVEDTFSRADKIWKRLNGVAVTDLIASAVRGREKTAEMLKDTRNTHPALFMCNYALFKAVTDMGVEPHYMIGHSLGELAALAAAGVFGFNDGMRLMDARSRAFAAGAPGTEGAMAAVNCNPAGIKSILEQANLELWISNYNSPLQNTVSGSSAHIRQFIGLCREKGIVATALNVSRAFHSPLTAQAGEQFKQYLENVRFRAPHCKVICCETGQYYPGDGAAIRTRLSSQAGNPVHFQSGIEQLYNDGVRLFIEVGPHTVLGSLVRDILPAHDCIILGADDKHKNAVEAFNRLACGLFAAGFNLDLLPVKRKAANTPALTGKTPSRKDKIVYSGAAVGLPGSYKDSFRDDNFEQLFDGRNCIEHLTDREKQSQVDLHITKLVKSERGAAYITLGALDEVIQLAGKLGKLDLAGNYKIDARDMKCMSSAIAYAVAAGYEALKDAQIPLVHEYSRTASGALLPGRWVLPQELQKETGIIFANGFPMIDPVIREVSKHVGARFGHSLRRDLFDFYETLLARISDRESRRILSEWYAANSTRIRELPGQDEIYSFNHLLMSQLASQANNKLAQYICAQGPNFSLNSACSSTVMAITLAEEMIRGGRVHRMIVIGADDTSNDAVLPYIGAGFLSTGACTSKADLYEAALPFDKRRDGMIMSSGAVGIVVEAAAECAKRGVIPVAELLGTHAFNTAGHQSHLDIPQYAEEMESFIARMEKEHGLDRQELAKQLLYMSHETYTPARGGCSQSEAVSLRHVFGDSFRCIEISNTKGMTGHTMGASIEDAVAAKALQYGRIPPVVNHRVMDPELEGLKLSTGGTHNCSYALRLAAGFGAQGNYLLLKKAASGDTRIADRALHLQWLQKAARTGNPELEMMGRVLTVKDTEPGAVAAGKLVIRCYTAVAENAADQGSIPNTTVNRDAVTASVFTVISEITGYAPEILESNMELEADLGIDTVKQATILARLGEKFGNIGGNEGIRISDYPTIGRIVELFSEPGIARVSPSPAANQVPVKKPDAPLPTVTMTVLAVIAEITGYTPETLETGMELEADLGIDTVKQATILSLLYERFGKQPGTNEIRLSDFPSIGHLVALFDSPAQDENRAPAPPVPGPAAETSTGDDLPGAGYIQSPAGAGTSMLAAVIAENSDYAPEMLEADLVLESDFGFDSGKLNLFKAAITKKLQITEEWEINPRWTMRDLEAAVKKLITHSANALPEIDLSRQVLALRAKPAAGVKRDFSAKTLLIMADHGETAEKAAAFLSPHFAHIQVLITDDAGSPAATADRLGNYRPGVIIDLTAMNRQTDQLDPEAAVKGTGRAADCRYAVMLGLDAHRPGRILCVTAADGAFGLGDDTGCIDPVYGIFCGFYKGLRKEWSETEISILDIHPRLLTGNLQEAFSTILYELNEKDNGVEICYCNGKRMFVAVEESCFQGTAGQQFLQFDAKDTIVVTGGASGITAEVLRCLAGQFKTNFAVIGRTEPLPNAGELAALSAAGLAALKKRIHADLSGKNSRVTPVMVEAEFDKVRKSILVYNLTRAVRQKGCGMQYYSADVRDKAALKKILDAVRRESGQITGIIHGAGIEKSHLMDKKTLQEFHAVHSVKTTGALNLTDLCADDPLKVVAAFSSISGRFGNKAQVDYAAANEFLCFWARALRRNRQIHAVSLIWSGWNGTGMAFNNTFVRENAEQTGLNLIDPRDGAQAASREICMPQGISDVIIHRGLGDFADAAMTGTDYYHLPFIDRIDHNGSYPFSSHRVFSVKRDAFIDQHRMNGTPLMPGVGYMEMMAEHLHVITGKSGALVYRELEFPNAFKLYRDESRELTLRCSPADDGKEWYMKITAPVQVPVKDNAEIKDYAEARVCALDSFTLPFDPQLRVFGKTTDTPVPEIFRSSGRFKQNVIFGALFNDSKRDQRSEKDDIFKWNEQGCSLECSFPLAQLDHPGYPLDRFLINPAFLDSLHQAGAILSILLTNQIYLPLGALEFGIVQPIKTPGTYLVSVQIIKQEANILHYDMVMQNREREVCYYIKNSVFHRINQ